MDTDFGASCYRRFLDGDESGFDDILKLYHDSLIVFINRFVRQYETAEDLAADTFMELLVHKKRYRFNSSFKTYLFSIARHKAIDYVRHESRYTMLSSDSDSTPALSEFIAMEENLIATEEKKKIREAIAGLPEDYATYLHLCYFEDLTADEIAKIMKKTKKQISNIAYRSKKALAAAMGKEGDT